MIPVRITIKAKVWAFILLILMLMLSSGLYTTIKLKEIGQELNELTEVNIPLVEVLSKIDGAQKRQIIHLERFFRLLQHIDYEQFVYQGKIITEDFKLAQKLVQNRPEARQKFKHLLSEYQNKLIELSRQHSLFERDAEELLEHIDGSKLGILPQLEIKLENQSAQLAKALESYLEKLTNHAFKSNHSEQSDANTIYIPLINSVSTITQKHLEQIIASQQFFRHQSREKSEEIYSLSQAVDNEFIVARELIENVLTTPINASQQQLFNQYLDKLKELDEAHANFDRFNFSVINEIKSTGIAELEEQEQNIEQESLKMEAQLNAFLIKVEKQTLELTRLVEVHEKNALYTSYIIYISAIIIAFSVGFWLIRNILANLKLLHQSTDLLSRGELCDNISATSQDEIGDLTEKFNMMQTNFRQIANKVTAFSEGDYEQIITPRTDKDEFGRVLSQMMLQIKERNIQIEESETRNRAIVDTAADGIITITEQGIIQNVNSAAEKIFQYSANEIIGKNINTLMPSPYREEHDNYLTNYQTTGIKKIIGSNREVSGQRKDGSCFSLSLSVGEIKLASATFFTGIVRDISEQKKNEATLKQKTEEMEQQNWFKSQIASIVACSSAGKNMLELAQAVMSELARILNIGHGAFYVRDINLEHTAFSLLASYAYSERKNISNTFRLGEGIIGQSALEQSPIHLTQVPSDYIKISSGLGEQTPLSIIAQPILFEHQTIGVIEIASFLPFTSTQVELVQQISESLGVVMNNAISKQNIQALLQESQRQSEELQTQQEELKTSNEELTSQTQALQESQVQLEEQKESLKASNEALEIRQNEIREQNQLLERSQAELEKKSKALEQSSKYKSEFLANMSHELRTPLNSLLILSKALADNKEGNLTDKQKKSASVIFEGGTNLLDMINDILDLSKVEAGKLEIEVMDIHIEDICQNLFDLFEQQAINKDLAFSTEIGTNTPKTISTDGHRLLQILRNFLSNAFKFTDNGSITLKAHSDSEQPVFNNKALTPNNTIGFSVIDTGTGIHEDTIHLIFEAFQQQDGSISRKYGGTGLGLTISRELTKLLGGEIHVTSTINEGSCFTLYIPLNSPPNATFTEEQTTFSLPSSSLPIKDPAKEPIKENNVVRNQASLAKATGQASLATTDLTPSPNRSIDKDGHKNYLLIVEDDNNFAQELDRIAKENGFKTLQARTGREALYLAMEHIPKGILLDIGLPDINGFEVIEQLKANTATQGIKVHVISGADLQSDSLSHGAYGFSMKPVFEDDVKKALLSLRANQTSPIKKILVVEDDSGERIAMDVLLSNDQTAVEYAFNGQEACEKLQSNNGFDCVILDLGLPDINGMEVLEKIREMPSCDRLPVIIYTGRELSEELQAKLHSYANDIIIKGSESPERLMDDIVLFVHSVDKHHHPSLNHDHSLLQGRKILLVDDDIRNIYALSSQLEQEEMEVDIADNGRRAVDILTKDSTFELILMDIMMPEMDGFEAMKKIRKLPAYKTIPIVALTAKAMQEDRAACIKAGASEYLAKPINMDQLLSMLKVWLYKPST